MVLRQRAMITQVRAITAVDRASHNLGQESRQSDAFGLDSLVSLNIIFERELAVRR